MVVSLPLYSFESGRSGSGRAVYIGNSYDWTVLEHYGRENEMRILCCAYGKYVTVLEQVEV